MRAPVVAGWVVTVAIYLAIMIPLGFITWQFTCIVGNCTVALIE